MCHLLRTKQISCAVAKHIAKNAWCLGVMAQLDTSTCQWFDYCRSAKKSVTGFNLNQCLEFLHHGVTVWNLTYYSLRACKEFLFNVSQFITSPLTASDKECIKQFLRGVFNTNPPVRQRPRLVTWNVDMVLDYLSGAGDNDAIPLNNLAGKACMLIMLSTMCRMGDAFQLDTREMAQIEEYISFRLSHPTKTFTDNNCDFGVMGLQTLVLRKFHDPKLCPMQAVLDYIHRTEGVRGSISKLFLVVGPHVKAASSQSVTRWTKQILINAGLGQFTVHSSRSASASCALLLGLPIDSIINQAGWKSQSTFVKNYMKRPMQGLSDKHKFSDT